MWQLRIRKLKCNFQGYNIYYISDKSFLTLLKNHTCIKQNNNILLIAYNRMTQCLILSNSAVGICCSWSHIIIRITLRGQYHWCTEQTVWCWARTGQLVSCYQAPNLTNPLQDNMLQRKAKRPHLMSSWAVNSHMMALFLLLHPPVTLRMIMRKNWLFHTFVQDDEERISETPCLTLKGHQQAWTWEPWVHCVWVCWRIFWSVEINRWRSQHR